MAADRFYPSSKTCSACGAVKAKLRLADRVFTCDDDACNHEQDRIRGWKEGEPTPSNEMEVRTSQFERTRKTTVVGEEDEALGGHGGAKATRIGARRGRRAG